MIQLPGFFETYPSWFSFSLLKKAYHIISYCKFSECFSKWVDKHIQMIYLFGIKWGVGPYNSNLAVNLQAFYSSIIYFNFLIDQKEKDLQYFFSILRNINKVSLVSHDLLTWCSMLERTKWFYLNKTICFVLSISILQVWTKCSHLGSVHEFF